MKRVFLVFLCLLVFSTPAFGQSTLGEPLTSLDSLGADGVSLLGGTVEWPEVRGHRFGACMQQVMLMEESLGSGFAYYDYGGKFASPADQAAGSSFDIHFISQDLCVLGLPAVVDYRFADNALAAVRIGVPVASQEEGTELLETLTGELTCLYSPEAHVSQGEHRWLIGYGYQFYATNAQQEAAEGFSGRVLLSCTQAEQAYAQWEQGQWWVNLQIHQQYRVDSSNLTAENAYSVW